jgi:hypothetical protein
VIVLRGFGSWDWREGIGERGFGEM